ncbi:Os03g0414200, partial [Oryza sativa Japonica Group]
ASVQHLGTQIDNASSDGERHGGDQVLPPDPRGAAASLPRRPDGGVVAPRAGPEHGAGDARTAEPWALHRPAGEGAHGAAEERHGEERDRQERIHRDAAPRLRRLGRRPRRVLGRVREHLDSHSAHRDQPPVESPKELRRHCQPRLRGFYRVLHRVLRHAGEILDGDRNRRNQPPVAQQPRH